MNFKDLENIAGTHARKAKSSKVSGFEVHLKKGLSLLKQAHQEGFKKSDTLIASSDALIDAITIQRTDTRPYLALAYLFTLIEDFKSAQKYAHAVTKLEPTNPELLAFLDKLKVFKKDVEKEALPSTASPFDIPKLASSMPLVQAESPLAKHETKFKELEGFIQEKTKHLFSSHYAHIEPTLDIKKINLLEESLDNLKKVIQYIEQEIQSLENKLNTSSLKEKAMPFQVLKGRYIQTIKTSHMLREVNDTIELWSFKTDKQVQVVNQTLTMSALTYGKVDVNRMMDGCDVIADQLDHISEDEGINISVVESAYGKLLSLVENLNDMVEDASEFQDSHDKLSDILS